MQVKIIARRRQCGKTYELIRLADKQNGYIVVPHADDIKEVKALAKKMGANINDPVTIKDVLNGSVRDLKNGTPLFFDDVYGVLYGLINGRYSIGAIAVNTGELPEDRSAKVDYRAPGLVSCWRCDTRLKGKEKVVTCPYCGAINEINQP